MLENLEIEELEFASAGDFMAELKREFGGGDNELAKVAKLKKLEQERRIMVAFVQEFRRVARESGYKE